MNEDWVLLGAKDPERRYRCIAISPDLLASILGGGFTDVFPMEPVADLRIVGGRFSSWRSAILFVVTSATFEPLSEEVDPLAVRWDPSFRRVTVDETPAAVGA